MAKRRQATLKIDARDHSRAIVEMTRPILVVIEGPMSGKRIEVTRAVILGRESACDLVLDDPAVSSEHARVEPDGNGLFVTDLDSTNGTLVNDVRIRQAHLGPMDRLALGKTVLTVEDEASSVVVTPSNEGCLGELVGQSPPMRLLFGLIQRLANTDLSVLILGETGTGKELVARTFHEVSHRSKGPFVVLDGTTLSGPLAASELFGHERGAFTGADRLHRGAFERAAGGTLFLDEIGELDSEIQAKLLRVVESRSFSRLGAEKELEADVRLLTATHRDLDGMVAAGTFREDLFYRFAELAVAVPPLRDRPGDIPLLVERLLERLRPRLPSSSRGIRLSPSALESLARHSWPGNVRELRNYLARAVALSGGSTLEEGDLPPFPEKAERPAPGVAPANRKLHEVEREMIEAALARNGGNKTAAARDLGIPASTLRDRIKRYDL